MSESLRNDGRVWVPKKKGDTRPPTQIPEDERDYYLERRYPSFGNLVPRDVASRAAKEVCDEGRGVGPGGQGVYLDFADAIRRMGEAVVREKYGNLFDMYEEITGENAYKVPMRIYPAVHYTMGGLWVDYQLMSHDSRPVRRWRSEFLRSRRQPARGQRADARAGGRLLHPSVHDSQLHRVELAGEGGYVASRIRGGDGQRQCADLKIARASTESARWILSTRNSAR